MSAFSIFLMCSAKLSGSTTSSFVSPLIALMRCTTCACVSPVTFTLFTSSSLSPRRRPLASAGLPASTYKQAQGQVQGRSTASSCNRSSIFLGFSLVRFLAYSFGKIFEVSHQPTLPMNWPGLLFSA